MIQLFRICPHIEKYGSTQVLMHINNCIGKDDITKYFKKEERLSYLNKYKEQYLLADSTFVKKPDSKTLRTFVFNVLDICATKHPSWITIPQLPIICDNSRNKINRALAELSNEWKKIAGFDGKFVLPLIFTQRDQLKNRTNWKSKIEQAKLCFKESDAHLIWVADSDLDDDSGKESLRDRLPQMIQFHIELKEEFEHSSLQFEVISGPYWAMNLILWARKLCKYPAICLGSSFRYNLSGGFIRRGSSRIVIPPLKRLVATTSALRQWLDSTLNKLSPDDPAHKQIRDLREKYSLLANEDYAKNQTANFYSKWIDQLFKIDSQSRPLTLYQDFSSAFVLGSQLDDLPINGTKKQKAGLLAQQLMFCCLQ